MLPSTSSDREASSAASTRASFQHVAAGATGTQHNSSYRRSHSMCFQHCYSVFLQHWCHVAVPALSHVADGHPMLAIQLCRGTRC
jgi:hypothetical protein